MMEIVSRKGKVRVKTLSELLLRDVNVYRFGLFRRMHLKKKIVLYGKNCNGSKVAMLGSLNEAKLSVVQ